MSAEISISELQPYETCLLTPSDHFQNLTEFLAGMPGSASLDFIVEAAFTRMLVGWKSNDGQELQVTHSNFNYSAHETDFVDPGPGETPYALMKLPEVPFEVQAVVYPDYVRKFSCITRQSL